MRDQTVGSMGKTAVMILIGSGLLVLFMIQMSTSLPWSSFFWMPSIIYLVVGIILLLLLRWKVERFQENILLWFLVLAFVVGGQSLITSQGVTTRWLGWGRFPLGDAADFLSGSVRILTDGEFVTIRGRPLANAFIAGLWRFTGFDLTLLSMAVTILCTVGLFVFGRLALSLFGVAAGFVAVAVSFDFLHEHIGAASTEPLGFFLGMAGAALLLTGAARRSVNLFSLGFFALSVTFVYRVGAVFVLPMILLWPFFVKDLPGGRLRAVLQCLLALAVVAGLHSITARTLAPDSPSFVNAPKSWYAIVAMGDEALGVRPEGSVREEARWVQIFDDNPGLRDLPIGQQGPRFLEIVTEAALARPLSVLVGTVLEYGDQLGRAGLFRFIDNKPIRLFVYLLFLTGLLFSLLRLRRDPVAALIALVGIGQILSIPFLHGGENRIHVGLAGLMSATVAYGLMVLLHRFGMKSSVSEVRGAVGAGWNVAAIGLPVAALALSLVTTFGLAGSHRLDLDLATACSQDEIPIRIAFGSGSTITIGTQDTIGLGLSFPDRTEMVLAADRWRTIGERSNAVFYAPITNSVLYHYVPENLGTTIFAADLTQGGTVILEQERKSNSEQSVCINRAP